MALLSYGGDYLVYSDANIFFGSLFRRNLHTDETEEITLPISLDISMYTDFSLSPNGSFASLVTRQSLDPVDINISDDVYCINLDEKTVSLVSLGNNGRAAGASARAWIGDTGNVIFGSLAGNLVVPDHWSGDMFLWNRSDRKITRLSNYQGNQIANVELTAVSPSLHWLLFETSDPALPHRLGEIEAYAMEVPSGRLIEFGPAVNVSTGYFTTPRRSAFLSDDGPLLAAVRVESSSTSQLGSAPQLTIANLESSDEYRIPQPVTTFSYDAIQHPKLSKDGDLVLFESNLAYTSDVGEGEVPYVYRRSTNTMEPISEGPSFTVGGSQSAMACSGDLTKIAFVASANNLTLDGFGRVSQLFISDQVLGEVRHFSVGLHGESANGKCLYPLMSANGEYVAYETYSSNLVTNEQHHGVCVVQKTDQTALFSISNADTEYRAIPISISDNGRYIVLETYIGPEWVDNTMRLRVVDLQTNKSFPIPTSDYFRQYPSNAALPVVSPDGRQIAYIKYRDGKSYSKYNYFLEILDTDTMRSKSITVLDSKNRNISGTAGKMLYSGNSKFLYLTGINVRLDVTSGKVVYGLPNVLDANMDGTKLLITEPSWSNIRLLNTVTGSERPLSFSQSYREMPEDDPPVRISRYGDAVAICDVFETHPELTSNIVVNTWPNINSGSISFTPRAADYYGPEPMEGSVYTSVYSTPDTEFYTPTRAYPGQPVKLALEGYKNYTVVIAFDGFLKRKVDGRFDDDLDLGELDFIAGDVDGNGKINWWDMYYMQDRIGDGSFDTRYDLDCDGAVTVFDLLICSQNQGRTYD
ncbi:MAG: PD40 domain-containing protein [Armatimonadetes bacterium]|nr:PD40 domain-containing protein [Armatimonadota bacterium]